MLDCINFVPHIYTKESRDMQFFLKLLELVVNSSKLNADSITNAYTPTKCPNRLLGLLATLYNYNSLYDITDSDLRIILDNYNFLTKYKGTRKGIEQAISIVVRLTGELATSFAYDILKYDEQGKPVYIIRVSIDGEYSRRYLQELMNVVMPVGFLLESYKASISSMNTRLEFQHSATYSQADASSVSKVSRIPQSGDTPTVIYRSEVIKVN